MKRIRIYALSVLCIVMSSCTEDLLQDNLTGEQNLTSVTLKAKGEISSDTKAAFVNYPNIAWQEEDKISVLGIKTGNQEFITAAAGHEVNFSGKADMSDEEFYAVYPYDENITLNADGTLANVTIPAIQTATANNFDPNAYIAIAKSTDKESLEFKSIGAFVKLNFQNFTSSVKSVTLVSNSGMTMAGTASSTTLNNDGSTSHSSVNSETASTSVKLQGTFDLSKGYFVIVRPDSYERGITIYVELEDGRVLSRKGNSALFEQDKSRNYIRPIILNANYLKEATDGIQCRSCW